MTASFFFFSSRRRHTRWPRDWSSDVCSSDLLSVMTTVSLLHFQLSSTSLNMVVRLFCLVTWAVLSQMRSEERRVGKECRTRGWSRWDKEKRGNTETRRDMITYALREETRRID